MADDTTLLVQQSDLLREIRDEMRSVRAGNPNGPVGYHNSVDAQVRQGWFDRAAQNQLSSYNWNMGFQPIYHPSLSKDILGAWGIARSPASMTQGEFQAVASENIGLRWGSLKTGLVAPGYTHEVNKLGEALYALSPRFARFGSSDSPLGVGWSRSTARSIAAKINTLGAGDIRLSEKDYRTIANVGAAGGQFDDTNGGVTSFLAQLKELANATATLTRQLHTSAEDISKAMVSVRSLGVTDIGQQKRILSNLGAAAQVAGISLTEMIGAGQALAQAGIAKGVSAATTLGTFGDHAAALRELRPQGLMSGQRIAAGGGITGLASTMTEFEQQALSSDVGFLSLIGRTKGATGGAVAEVNTGLATVSGKGLYGTLEYQMRRADIIGAATPEDAAYAAKSVLAAQVKMAGIQDLTSPRAQAVAYGLLRGQGLSDSAAYAYSALNFSQEGNVLQAKTKRQAIAAQRLAEKKEEGDLYYTTHTLAGQIRQGMASGSQTWSGMLHSLGETTQTGWMSGQLKNQIDMGSTGLLASPGTMSSRIETLGTTPTLDTEVTGVDIESRVDPYYGNLVGGLPTAALAGFAVGAGAVAMTGGLALVPMLAWGAASVGASLLAGSGLPFEFGYGLAGAIGNSNDRVRGKDAQDYLRLQKALKQEVDPTKTLATIAKLKDNREANEAISKVLSLDMSDGRSENSQEALRVFQDASAASGLTLEELANVRRTTGIETNFAHGIVAEIGSTDMSQFKKEMTKIFGSGPADSMTVNFGLSENVGAFREYIQSFDENDKIIDNEKFIHASAKLTAAGATGAQLRSARTNYARIADKEGFLKRTKAFELRGGSMEVNRELSSLSQYASDILESSKDSRATQAKERLAKITDSDPRELLDALNDTSSVLGSTLIQNNALFKAMSEVAPVEQLKKMSAKDIAKRYGIADEAGLKKEIDTVAKSGNWEGLRRELQLQVGREGGTESKMASDVRVASLLNQAAATLERVNGTSKPPNKPAGSK